MKLVDESQIEANEQMLSDCSAEDAAMINTDPNLTPNQRYAAMMDPETYKFNKNNPYIMKDASNYPALFQNIGNPDDFAISRKYQNEFMERENQLKSQMKTQGAFENAWNSFRYSYESMKLGDLNAEYMDAVKEENQDNIKEIEKKILEQREYINDLTPPSREGFSGTFGSIAASFGRELPVLVATGVATAALTAASAPSAGVTAPAAAATAGRFAVSIARVKSALSAYKATKAAMIAYKAAPYVNNIVNAGYIYNDTANIARGSMYDYLKKAHPEMSEEEAQQKAWVQGRLEGMIEAGTAAVGMAAFSAGSVYRTASREFFKRGLVKTVTKGISDESEKAAMKNAIRSFVDNGLITPKMVQSNSFGGQLVSKLVKLKESRLAKAAAFGLDMSVEGATEDYQNEIEKIIKGLDVGESIGYTDALVTANSNIAGYVGEVYDHIVSGKPMSENAQNAFDTFTNVSVGSALLGVPFAGMDYASNRLFRNKAQALGNQLDNANKTINTFDTILNQKKTSDANKLSPKVTSDFYKNAKEAGELPENLYVDLDRLKAIVDSSKDDAVIMAKLNSLKVNEKIAEAEKDGGLVEFDTNEFIDTVVDPENDMLYQKIKGDITSNPAMNSKNDVMEIVNLITKNDEMMKDAKSDSNSIYNYVLKQQKEAGTEEELANVNAIMAQSFFNTFYRMRDEKQSMSQIMEQIKLRVENVDKISEGDLNQIYFDVENSLAEIRNQKAELEKSLDKEEIEAVKKQMQRVRSYKYLPVFDNSQMTEYAELILNERDYVGILKQRDKENTRYMYVGKKSKTALSSELDRANTMYASGVDMNEIFKETGWFIDPRDGQWKYEISDKDAKINVRLIEKMFNNIVKEQKLKDVLNHDKLFEAYPEFEDMPVIYNSHLRNTLGYAYKEKGILKIDIKKTDDYEALKSTILHEIQHQIQEIEGFGKGGMPKSYSTPLAEELYSSNSERQKIHKELWEELKASGVKPSTDIAIHPTIQDARKFLDKLAEKKPELKEKLKRLDELDERLKRYDEGDNYMKYYKLPGENESRDTQYRAKMTDEERRKEAPANLSGKRAPVVRFTVENDVLEIYKTDIENTLEDLIAGSIQFGAETIIRLSKISNPTTFSHEMFHLFGRQLFEMFNSGNLNERWSKHAKTLAEFLGLEETEDGRYNFAGNEKAEEKLAEAGVSYLETGKAPAGYLKELFDIIGEWFATVFKLLKMAKVELDPKVTKVFDEIFVPYEKQQQILIERRYGFIPKPANMTDAQYADYMAQKRAAAARGTTEELKSAAKMHEIMSNETYKAEYDEAYRTAYDDLGLLPVYQLLDDVIKNKISRDSLKKIPSGIIIPRNYLSSKQGYDITQFYAEYTNIANSVEELAQILSETPSRETAAQYAAEQHMKEWLKENYPEVEEINSEISARNEAVMKLSVMEYMMLSGIDMARFNQEYNDMLAIAEYLVQKMPLQKIVNVQRWIEQESKLMQKYDYVKTDKQKAQLKRQQAFLNYYTLRAKQLKTEATKFNRHSKKYRGAQTKEVLRTIDGDTFDLLKSLLNKFGLTKAQPNTAMPLASRIEDWIVRMTDGEYSSAEEIARYKDALIAGIGAKLTTADFELLKEAFGFIEAVGREKKLIQVEGKKIQVEEAADNIARAFEKNNIKPMDKELGSAVMRESVFREVFPVEEFLEFFAPLFKGLTEKDLQIQTWRNQLEEILKPFADTLSESHLIDGRAFTTEQLLVMMLNSGNTHNINCMVRTLQESLQDPDFGVESLFSILNQAPKELRQATRSIWKIFDDNKQTFQEVQRKIDGKVLKFVEPEAYTFEDGEEMPGGYYPAGKKSVILNYEQGSNTFKNSGTYATKSFQKDRSFVHGDLDLTLGTLNGWFYKMAGIIHTAVPYNNIGKLLKNQTFRKAVGDGMVTTIDKWMKTSVAPDKVNQFLSTINQFAAVGALGLKWHKAFTQMAGMIPAMAEVGPTYVLGALITTNPIRAIDNASKLSRYMFARYAHPEDHLQLYVRAENLLGDTLKTLDKLQATKVMNAAMSFIIYGDAIASEVTWKAEFNKQKEAGFTDSQASDLADSAVRRLQGDNTAGSRPPLLQGDKRFFTMFASYFIGIHSMLVAHKIKGDKVKMAGLLIAAAVAAPMFESLVETAKDWMFSDDDDKEKWKKEGIENSVDLYLKKSLANIVSSAASFWIPHFGFGSSAATALTKGKIYSPKNIQIEYMLKPVESAMNITQAAFEEDEKKAHNKAKKGLKKLFEFGMMNTNVADYVTDLIMGE